MNTQVWKQHSYFINGMSSLLFIIPAIKSLSLHKQEFISWKLLNCTLVGISFLCNANNYKEPYLLLDHINILLISLNYIGFSFYSGEWISRYFIKTLLLLSIIEYQKYKTIDFTKNMSIAISILKLVFYLQILIRENHSVYLIIYYKSLIYSTIIASVSYGLRRLHISPNIISFRKIKFTENDFSFFITKLTLTTVFHICITIILYVTNLSLTYCV
jgi:hypothetical protein